MTSSSENRYFCTVCDVKRAFKAPKTPEKATTNAETLSIVSAAPETDTTKASESESSVVLRLLFTPALPSFSTKRDTAAIITDEKSVAHKSLMPSPLESNASSPTAVTVNAGTFNGRIENYYGTPSIKGGTFSADPTRFVAAGYTVTDNGDGTWTVGPYKVSTANELTAALAAGGKVKLVENIQLSNTVEIPAGVAVEIDLNGKNIGTLGSTKGCPLYLKGGKLTIKNGTLDLDGSETNEHGTFSTAIGYDAQSVLVVENVTFTGQTAINGTFATNGPLTITVSNSTINATNVGIAVAGESPDAIATVNNCNINAGKYAIFASQGAKITINGGTYKSAENVITSMYEGSVVTVNGGSFEGNLLITAKGALVVKGGTFSVDPTAYLASGYVATESNGTWTVTAK